MLAEFLSQMTDRDVVSWTAMITAYARYGYGEEALALFNEMQRSGIEPDHFTFSCLLPVCTNFAVLKRVHEEIIRSGFHSDAFVGNALVDMYAKCRHVKDRFIPFVGAEVNEENLQPAAV